MPAYVRAFSDAGFAIARFDRDPQYDDADAAADWLRDALRSLRRMGWRKIVIGGQSRGAWNALQMLSEPGLADAVVAISPANFGGSLHSDNAAALWSILHAAAAPSARVAVAEFAGDNFVGDMDRRIALLRDGLQGRVGALLIIDRPDGITGHGGGNGAAFAARYASCLARFVVDPSPPSACPPTAAR
jgi:dienelactone hydrolase